MTNKEVYVIKVRQRAETTKFFFTESMSQLRRTVKLVEVALVLDSSTH